MKIQNLAGFRSIDQYVSWKLGRLEQTDRSFSALYELMFSERENILFESSEGYRIKKTTYGECKDEIERLAPGLKQMLSDAPTGSAVGLFLENGLAWIECYWAILRAGFCPLLLNARLGKEILEDALARMKAVAVISGGEEFSIRTIRTDEMKPSDAALPQNAPFGEEFYFMSSGTSETVKICAYSAKELACQILDTREILAESKLIKRHYEGELKLLAFLPFYHIFGFVALYAWFTFFSRTLVELKDLSPDTILSTIRRHKVTHLFAVPLFWNRVYAEAMKTIGAKEETAKKFQKGMELSRKLQKFPAIERLFSRLAYKEVREKLFGESISYMITGGSEIHGEVLEFFNAIGYHLSNGYGMTEVGITSVELSDDKRILDGGSVGKPLPSAQYSVDEGGQLLIKSTAAAKYVLEGDRRIEKNGWFLSKDLAKQERGRYFILGRSDDLVVSEAGENLNPTIIEAAFSKIEHLQSICLVGIKKESRVEPLLIASVDRRINQETADGLRAALQKKLDELQLTGQIRKICLTSKDLLFGDEIKLNRRRIAKRYQEGAYPELTFGSATSELGDELSRRVALLFSEALGRPVDTMGEDYHFFSDGEGTSLDYFSLAVRIEKEFSVPFPVSGGLNLCTIGQIADYIREQKKS
ncbi:MAG: non-ribosomal peptide synthetase [Clostridia bacterium]|nr:non-ribosomal peptide synthetase [Clostridia bacterium]